MATGKQWAGRIGLTVVGIIVVILAMVIGLLTYFHIPSNGAGMAAQSICSAAFMAGRPGSADQLMAEDVLPANGMLKAISTTLNRDNKTATSSFLGLVSRTSSLTPDRGCVLDLPPSPNAQPYDPASMNVSQWPVGNGPLPAGKWPAGVNQAGLQDVVNKAFNGAGDPASTNGRGVAVVYDNQLLVAEDAPGFPPAVGLHGWSMTKTVAAMLAYKKFQEVGLDIQSPVVDSFPQDREPAWVAQWRRDERAKITVADLLYMRDGLNMNEGYGPTDDVVQMLYGEPDMAAWAASHPADAPAGTRWRYLSATSNILAAVARGQFENDAEYWAYPQQALTGPIGATTASLATDTSGTWVGSSYEWAAVGDWARLGQVMLNDGVWEGQRVLPESWLDVATAPAMPSGDGHGYGGQTWLLGDPVGGECRTTPGFPADTMAMEGHWGQIVAMIPSKNAVVVRLGWTFDKTQFDMCQLVADVVAQLPAS